MSLATANIYNVLPLVGLVFLVLRAIYRITFHPLAKFPGPKLAGMTNLYAIKYDLITKDSLVKHLHKLHAEFGPIVRVRPNELHVFDWEAYQTVFKPGAPFNRVADFYNAPQVDGSFFNKADTRTARPHRDLYIQSFSKAKINELEPLIHSKLAIFLQRLHEATATGRTVNLDMGFGCLTADVTMHYCYQMSLGLLDSPEFRAAMLVQLHDFAPLVPVFWYFPTLGMFMNKVIFSLLPYSIVKVLFPAAASMLDIVARCRSCIGSLAAAPPDSQEVANSIFRKALNPNREKGQYVATADELTADAVLMFLAGTDTTAHALTFGAWGMIKRPELWKRLRAEVEAAVQDNQTIAAVQSLESLPFLRAIVKESLRLSMGPCARLPRVVPAQGAVLCGQPIPAHTQVSFSHHVYNNDPIIFPDPSSFRPERWLESPNTEELDSCMVSFSRGSRGCIGMNLAYAELYTIFAHLVRRFDIENAGTTDADMDWMDTYTPRINGPLKVRLRAT